MNQYVTSQCRNMITMVSTFENACEVGVLEDDGYISKEEAKALKIIHKASARYKKQLEKAITIPSGAISLNVLQVSKGKKKD